MAETVVDLHMASSRESLGFIKQTVKEAADTYLPRRT